jgi:hypothetical protein
MPPAKSILHSVQRAWPRRRLARRVGLRGLVALVAATALAACAHAPDAAACADAHAVAALQDRIADLEGRLDRAEYALVAVSRRAPDPQCGTPLARDAANAPRPALAPRASSAQELAQSVTASISRLLAAQGAATDSAGVAHGARVQQP